MPVEMETTKPLGPPPLPPPGAPPLPPPEGVPTGGVPPEITPQEGKLPQAPSSHHSVGPCAAVPSPLSLPRHLMGPPPLIDDSIDSDVIHDPVEGSIYKIKDLNILARFVKATHVLRSVDHHSCSWEHIFALEHHGTFFRINTSKGVLLKANWMEIAEYLEKDEILFSQKTSD